MIEICSVLVIVGLIALLNWVDLGRIARRMRHGADQTAEKSLLSAVRENAVLVGRPITIQTGKRELTFFPDGRVDEKAIGE